MSEFKHILLNEIQPSPINPRGNRFNGEGWDELVASIKQVGVLEPIKVRPVGDHYEIVFGERRWRASLEAGLETVPAIIEALSDDDAYDQTIMENHHREDLTEMEEAQSFHQYVQQKGYDIIEPLAERLSVNPRYIRRRVEVVRKLPTEVIELWGEGKLKYGHLEQLIRLETVEEVNEKVAWVLEKNICIRGLKQKIDEKALALEYALFDKSDCKMCHRNTQVQKSLFAFNMDDVKCLKPECFKKRQMAYFQDHWKETEAGKANGTNSCVIEDDIKTSRHFFSTIPQKCFACKDFVTTIRVTGDVVYPQVCIGEKACFDSTTKGNNAQKVEQAANNSKPLPKKIVRQVEDVREKYYEDKLPQVIGDLKESEIASITLFSILKANAGVHKDFFLKNIATDAEKKQPSVTLDDVRTFEYISEMTPAQVKKAIRDVSLSIVMSKTFGSNARRLVAEQVGIDLANWKVNDAYLQKKSKADLLALGKELGIFSQTEARKYLHTVLRKSFLAFDKCSKQELIDLFLKSGIDLNDKIPSEIRNAA
jgi:ParB/RepB/Spo0J family partition protein